jgi:hypothetical protein
MSVAIFSVLFALELSLLAQQPTRGSLEAKKNQLTSLESAISDSKKKMADLENQLKALAELQAQLTAVQQAIEGLEEQAEQLREEIPEEEEQITFSESPPRTIVAVEDNGTYVIDFNGTRKPVVLHGIYMDSWRIRATTQAFRKRLVKKQVYVRCADPACSLAYIYGSKTGMSLNAELIQAGVARASDDAKYDVAALTKPTQKPTQVTPTSPTYSGGYSSSRSTPGKDVHVGGYRRKDGTYVGPHTRSAPGTRSSSRRK